MLDLPVRFVFLRPRNPENVGAVARALKNCGFSDWALVDPSPFDKSDARRVAVQALDVLDAAKRCTLDEAISDCSWVVGTTSRRLPGRRRWFPRALAAHVVERAASGRTAILFGDERSGLTNEDLAHCHDVSCIPSALEQPSFNLAQATLLYAYELRLAAMDAQPSAAPLLPRAADVRALEGIEQVLKQVLEAGGFLQHEERHGVGDLMKTLQRARLTKHEAGLWNAALRSLIKSRRD